MPNITSVTNPVPGQEGNNTYRSPITPNDPHIQNIPDPSRVGRADARTDRQDTATAEAARRYDSYFQAFLKELRSSGTVAELMAHFLASRQGTLVTSGLTAGISHEIAQLLQMLSVDDEALFNLLKGQLSGSARFHGPLFDALREALQQNPSASLKADILQFLKKYNDFSSTAHIERNLQRTLQQMSWFMPNRFSEALGEQLSSLNSLLMQNNRAGALRLLQGTIVPYLSDYVAQIHDRGISRSLMGLLLLDIARYENGSPQSMLQSFYQLLGYAPLKRHFGDMDASRLLLFLQENAASANQPSQPLTEQLLQVASQAMRGDGGADLRQTFQALMDSILINQSVYMPLMHAMLPVEMDGRMMFSELWVDPDAENEANGESSGGRAMRLLLKFDIQDLGLFDLVITFRDSKVEASLLCPRQLSPFTELFEEKMASLAAKEGLDASSMRAAPMVKPLAISEVFPKIFERKDSINVAV